MVRMQIFQTVKAILQLGKEAQMNALVVALLVAAPPVPANEDVLLLDFTAPYCGPCKTIQPHINALKNQGYPIRQIDISKQPNVSRQFRVDFVPTFILLVNGKEQKRFQGTTRVGELKGLMDAAIGETRKPNAASQQRPDPPPRATPRQVEPKKKPSFLDRLMPGRREKPQPEPRGTTRGQEPAKEMDIVTKGTMAASVRIRVTYDGKTQFGTGTIVQSRQGRSVILTCAHIMDLAGDNPKVQVDVFIKGKARTFVGKIVGHNIESDVGLIAIPTSSRLPYAPIARPDLDPKKGETVFSIGCNNGKDPTRENATLTAIDRYIGPNNFETNHAPENGRSGGGLFNSKGRIIGVCSAANYKQNTGLYAGNKAIFDMLKKHKLQSVYGEEIASKPEKKRTTLYDSDTPSDRFDPAAGAFALQNPGDVALFEPSANNTAADIESLIPAPIHATRSNDAGSAIRRKIDELGGDAEVTVVIRPRDPRKSSQIVVIPHASSNFISLLQGEVNDQPQHTSFVRPVAQGKSTAQPKPNRASRYNLRASTLIVPNRTAASRSTARPQQPTAEGQRKTTRYIKRWSSSVKANQPTNRRLQ